MSFLNKIFAKKTSKQTDFIEAKVPSAVVSQARDEFYEDLKAQEKNRQDRAAMEAFEEMSDSERMEAAKALLPVNPLKNLKVARVGENPDGLVDTEDAAPAGRVYGDTAKYDDGRFADIWSTYARINPRILKHFISRAFVGYPACQVLGTHEIINPCCAMPGEDAISPGYKLICSSESHKQDDQHLMAEQDWLLKLKKTADKSGVNKTCSDLAFYTRLYGIGVAVPRVKLKEGHTLEEEYDPSLIEPHSFKGFSVVDPQRFTWDMTDETLYDPLSEYYMKPEFLRLYNRDQRIHRSWCLINIYKEVGDDLKATYMWGGVPLSQMLYERVFCADKLANEIVALAMSKRTVVKDGNLKAMIAEPNKTNHFIERWNGYRNNQAIAFKEPGEQIQQLETSLADLQPLSAQQYQYAAAIAGIPVTKLLKNVPSGLQATGQYEQDEYEQTLKNIQSQCYEPFLARYYEIYIASNYPERTDLSVEIEFNPIQLPKAQEIQQISSQKASMVCQLVQTGIATATEGRAILRAGDSPTFQPIASATPEIIIKMEEAKDPEKQQEMQMKMQQAMSGMNGMPGMGMNSDNGGQPPDSQQSTQFEQNKKLFQDALNEVLRESNTQNGDAGENAGIAGSDGNGDSDETIRQAPDAGNNNIPVPKVDAREGIPVPEGEPSGADDDKSTSSETDLQAEQEPGGRGNIENPGMFSEALKKVS